MCRRCEAFMMRRPGESSDIAGVSLDFFGTLVVVDDDRPSMARLLTSLGYTCTDVTEALWNTHGYDGQETPTHSSDPSYFAWRRANLVRLASSAGVPASRIDSIVETLERNDQSWTVKGRQGASDLLEFLLRHDVPAVICSNWDYDLAPYLRQAGLPEDFPCVLSSYIGVRKPATRIFLEAARRLGLPPRAVLHVGDSVTADVVGALRAGMHAGFIGPAQEVLGLPDDLVRVFSSLTSVQHFLRGRSGD
ncbi:HAD family hydrolase [Streptomyces massasporeus]|uniref:HAD family hydrolase n=1 Tax=Streptomyces massasporeus TaxID=67324 RepID=UPI0036C8BF2B